MTGGGDSLSFCVHSQEAECYELSCSTLFESLGNGDTHDEGETSHLS